MQNCVALGVDFGTRYWGVAVGNLATGMASPCKSLRANQGVPNWQEFIALCQQWRPNVIVFGLPLNMDGTAQPITHQVKEIAAETAQRTGLPVQFQDERLSTVEARAILFERGGYKSLTKDKVDALSAVIILEDWFENQTQ